MRTFEEYQKEAVKFAFYPPEREGFYLSTQLVRETCELLDPMLKRVRRGGDLRHFIGQLWIRDEVGDICWYLANMYRQPQNYFPYAVDKRACERNLIIRSEDEAYGTLRRLQQITIPDIAIEYEPDKILNTNVAVDALYKLDKLVDYFLGEPLCVALEFNLLKLQTRHKLRGGDGAS